MRAVPIAMSLLLLGPASVATAAKLELQAAASDPSARQVEDFARAGTRRIEHFFGGPFLRPIDFRLAPSRAAFDAAFPPALGMGKSECWMVGMGIGDRMVLLSPSAWKAEACEHDPADAIEVQRLIAHELTHVYHGQHNPHPDFAGEDDLGWWIEGLAVLVAGQLTPERVADVRTAIAAGKAPAKLDAVWSGKLRYAFAGSLAAYIDARWGREMTRRLLAATSTAEALAMLGTTEPELLDGWKQAAAGRAEMVLSPLSAQAILNLSRSSFGPGGGA